MTSRNSNVLTQVGVARMLARGLKSLYNADQAPKELDKLTDLLLDMAMSRDTDREFGSGEHKPCAKNDADWLDGIAVALETEFEKVKIENVEI